MDLESSSSQSGSSFGSVAGVGAAAGGSLSRLNESVYSGNNHGYPFPLFGMRNDNGYGISRRSSRTNSFSMDSRHVRKPSEDTHMSDGGNQSGSERSRRHSPAVVPFERSVRRSALLPKPKGLLKVFSQLEEEVHHNRHEYDHERETTQATTNRLTEPQAHLAGTVRRQSTSRLNPDNELNSRSKIGPLPSPSGTGSFFRHGHGPLSVGSSTGPGPGPLGNGVALSGAGASGEDLSRSAANGSGSNTGIGSVPGPSLSSTLNLQHTSRSFSELSLGLPKDPPQ
ncbi:hypothetical protein BGZ68_007790 [Mortierella alpina]|nr:hypothetical protein BGZ68_007790 [Mortierella alpina]